MNFELQKWLNDGSRSLQFYGIFRFAVILLMGILLVKCEYPTSEINIFEKYLFYTSSLSFFISAAINKALISNNLKNSDLPLIPLGLMCTSISLIIAFFITRSNPEISTSLTLSLLLVLPFSNSLEYFLLVRKKIRYIYILGTLLHISWLLVFVFYLFHSKSIETILRAYVLFHALKTILSIAFLNKSRVNLNYSFTSRIFVEFLFIGLISGLMDYIDGYLVQWVYPEFDFSVFRYGARELPLISIILTSVASGYVIKIQESPNWQIEMKERVKKIIFWLFPLIAGLMIISPWLFRLVFSDDYVQSAQFFNLYMLLILSRIFIGQSILLARMKNQFLLFLSILELVLNIIFSLLFSSVFGIYGILLGTIFAYLIQKLVLAFYLEKRLMLSVKDFFPFRTYLLFGSLVILCFVLSQNIF